MSPALKMVSVVMASVLMADVKKMPLEVLLEHSVIDTMIVKTLLERVVLENQPSIRISPFASHPWKRTWFVVPSTSLKMFTLELRYKELAAHARQDLYVSKLEYLECMRFV